MKVRFICDSGANIHSANKSEWMDVEEDLNISPEEWEEMSEKEKYKMAEEWAWNDGLEIYFDVKED